MLTKLGSNWAPRVNGICLIAPIHCLGDLLPEWEKVNHATTNHHPSSSSSFANFISTRCRGYVVHEAELGTLVEGRAEYGCNVYASGEHLYVECVMIRAWRDMLAWFGRLNKGDGEAEERWEMPEYESALRKENGEMVEEIGWAPDVSV